MNIKYKRNPIVYKIYRGQNFYILYIKQKRESVLCGQAYIGEICLREISKGTQEVLLIQNFIKERCVFNES